MSEPGCTHYLLFFGYNFSHSGVRQQCQLRLPGWCITNVPLFPLFCYCLFNKGIGSTPGSFSIHLLSKPSLMDYNSFYLALVGNIQLASNRSGRKAVSKCQLHTSVMSCSTLHYPRVDSSSFINTLFLAK